MSGQEARNLAALTSGQTPLLGGESPHLEEGTGFGGAAPRRQRMTTPSAMVVAGAASGGGSTPVPGTPSTVGGLTPGGRAGPGGGGGTPVRDEVRKRFRNRVSCTLPSCIGVVCSLVCILYPVQSFVTRYFEVFCSGSCGGKRESVSN